MVRQGITCAHDTVHGRTLFCNYALSITHRCIQGFDGTITPRQYLRAPRVRRRQNMYWEPSGAFNDMRIPPVSYVEYAPLLPLLPNRGKAIASKRHASNRCARLETSSVLLSASVYYCYYYYCYYYYFYDNYY